MSLDLSHLALHRPFLFKAVFLSGLKRRFIHSVLAHLPLLPLPAWLLDSQRHCGVPYLFSHNISLACLSSLLVSVLSQTPALQHPDRATAHSRAQGLNWDDRLVVLTGFFWMSSPVASLGLASSALRCFWDICLHLSHSCSLECPDNLHRKFKDGVIVCASSLHSQNRLLDQLDTDLC